MRIKAEIDKYQLLCVPCHKKVTAYEYACGFIAQKRYLHLLTFQTPFVNVKQLKNKRIE